MQQQVARIKTRDMQLIEIERGRPIEDLLRELYVERELTVEEVGAELGISMGAVSRWLALMGIPARHRGTRRKAVA